MIRHTWDKENICKVCGLERIIKKVTDTNGNFTFNQFYYNDGLKIDNPGCIKKLMQVKQLEIF